MTRKIPPHLSEWIILGAVILVVGGTVSAAFSNLVINGILAGVATPLVWLVAMQFGLAIAATAVSVLVFVLLVLWFEKTMHREEREGRNGTNPEDGLGG